jgi:plasmid maintenance system antidote protein VapI
MFEENKNLQNYSFFTLSQGLLLQEIIIERNIHPRELFPILGPKSNVMEIINGKKVLTSSQIQELSEFFKVNPDVFSTNQQKSESQNYLLDQSVSADESNFNKSTEKEENDSENTKPFWEK